MEINIKIEILMIIMLKKYLKINKMIMLKKTLIKNMLKKKILLIANKKTNIIPDIINIIKIKIIKNNLINKSNIKKKIITKKTLKKMIINIRKKIKIKKTKKILKIIQSIIIRVTKNNNKNLNM